MFKYAMIPGQSLGEAIVHAGVLANLNGFNGYSVVCSYCHQPIHDHENPSDCEVFNRIYKEPHDAR